MKPWRRGLMALVLVGAAIAAGMVASNLIRGVQFAHAQQDVEATRKQLAQVNDLAEVFRAVGKTVEPSVVSIDVVKTVRGISRALPFGDDELLRKFFEQHGQEMPDLREIPQEGVGSGVIIEVENGSAYVVTNNHVVSDADELRITLYDGRIINNGKVLGTDAKTDLAVIKINVDRVIPAKWGDSDELQKGDWILAFGSPFRYVGSMTHGIVSAVNRHDVGILASAQGYENFIQVDAAINPGNSGGALVNIRGEVVGINTAIATRTGSFAGIGFAIPSNQAKSVYAQLKESGKVVRGWLGVGIMDVATYPGLAKSFGLKEEKGVLVNQIIPGTPATGKLERGDVIVAVDGQSIESTHALRNLIAAKQPGSQIKLTVMRKGEQQEVTVELGEQPENLLASSSGVTREPSQAEQKPADVLGMRLATPNRQQLEMRGIKSDERGAMVTEVQPLSAAARAGIRPGDLITEVADEKVTNAKEAMAALGKHNVEEGVRLYVISRDAGRYVFLQANR